MEVIESSGSEFWENIVSKCEYATFFHTPKWSEILEKTYPHFRVATKLFLFDDGARAVLPLIESKELKGILRSCYSMPFTLYGGAISDKSIDKQKVDTIFELLARKYSKLAKVSITGNPYCDYGSLVGYRAQSYFTQVLDLDNEFDIIWSNYKPSVRNKIRKAEKNGVYARPADSLEDYKEYFGIYQTALERWGEKTTSRYGFALFGNIHEIAGINAKLWLVYYADRVVGGTLVFYYNWHSVEWHAAFDSGYFKFGTRNYLANEIIKDAIQNGFKVYDFNPSGGHEGVVDFKKSMGAEKVAFKLWHLESTGYRLLYRARRLFPLSFGKRAGI